MNDLHDDLNLLARNDQHLRQWKPPKLIHHENIGDAVAVGICILVGLFALATWLL